MIPFNVLSPGGFIDEQNAIIALNAFARFYHTVTPKHQRRIKLIIVDEEDNILTLHGTIQTLKIEKAVELIPRYAVERVEGAYRKSDVFLFPSQRSISKVIPEALSYGLPILTIDNDEVRNYIDKTCGMTVRRIKQQQLPAALANMLQMLYFDPEVRKILHKGAKRKYRNHFSWGVYERRQRQRQYGS